MSNNNITAKELNDRFTEPCCFSAAIEEALEEWHPEVEEIIEAAEILLMDLARKYYDLLNSDQIKGRGFVEMTCKDNLNSIKKAIRHLRATVDRYA